MNRRGFLAGLLGAVGGIVLEEAIPLGRVWSPSKIWVYDISQGLWHERGYFLAATGNYLIPTGQLLPKPVGTTIKVRFPQRFVIRDSFIQAGHLPRRP
jgi:hypothetical protein